MTKVYVTDVKFILCQLLFTVQEDRMDMTELYAMLPSIDETVKRVTRNTESQKTCMFYNHF